MPPIENIHVIRDCSFKLQIMPPNLKRWSAVLILTVGLSCFAFAGDQPGELPPTNLLRAQSEAANCFSFFKSDAAGHAWANAYLLALACHYNYHEKLDVKPFEDFEQFQEKYKALFIPWGIDTFEFIQSSGSKFDTELIVMSRSDGDFVIVVFRGSEFVGGPVSAAKDAILTDANIKLLDVSDELGDGVAVHAGFWNAFLPVKDEVLEAIEKQGGFSEGKKLWITGNSLGGALANLCALWLRKEGHAVQGVYTYGAPRCGNDRFRERYENDSSINCQRWVNDNDIVPMLPPLKEYHHVGVLNTINRDGSVTLDAQEYERIGNPLKHYQEFYAYRIYHAMPKQIRKKMPPPPELPAVVKPFL